MVGYIFSCRFTALQLHRRCMMEKTNQTLHNIYFISL